MTRTSKRLASLVLALLLVVLTAATALAKEQTVTLNLNVKVPIYGKTALGSLVLKASGTPDNMSVGWTFGGQIDGKKASASGRAEGKWTGSGYEGSLTKIQSWSMPGIAKPNLPLRIALSDEGSHIVNVTIYTAHSGNITIPFTYTGIDSIPAPFGGDLAFSVTNDTISPVTALPRTGDVPLGFYIAPLALVVLGGGVLFGATRLRRREAQG